MVEREYEDPSICSDGISLGNKDTHNKWRLLSHTYMSLYQYLILGKTTIGETLY